MSVGPIIEIKSLQKTFPGQTGKITALQDINLQIMEKDIFGIIGASGAGKSTLVRCINFLERPSAGTVFFNGHDLSMLSDKELRKARQSMGMIFQQFNLLLQRTALANICFPMEIAGYSKAEAKERAKELLELVHLADKANAYPSQLSGGQKQRIAIARALATNPKVLLCDEATSALDPNSTASILALLKDINEKLGITIIIITHEMSVIEQICNRVAIIDQSQIAECGEMAQIFANPKTQAAQKLVFPEKSVSAQFQNKAHSIRIVFNGNSSFEPVIANMVLTCKAPVNIIYADTKNIDGKAFGQIVIQLPEDKTSAERMIHYLKARDLAIEEVGEIL